MREQVMKMQKRDELVAAGKDPDAEEKPRAPDGKFVKKDEPEPAEQDKPAPAPEKPAKPAEPVKPAKPVEAAPVKPVETAKPATPVAFDADAVLTKALESVGKKKYKDAPGEDGQSVEVDGSQLMADYAQVTEPLRDVIKEALTELNRQHSEEISQLRAQINAPVQKQAADKMVEAVTALVPDFPTLNVDPRFHEFLDKNPQYEGLVSTDPARASDMAWLCDKFRDTYKITKPTAKPAAVEPEPVKKSRSVQAAVASARGSSAGVGSESELTAEEVSKLPEADQEEYVRRQAIRWQREDAQRRRDSGE